MFKRNIVIFISIFLIIEISGVLDKDIVVFGNTLDKVQIQPVGEKVGTIHSNSSLQSTGYINQLITRASQLDRVEEEMEMFYFVPMNEKGTNNYIEIHYTHSSLLIPTLSTLTVYIDDEPQESVFLTEETSDGGKLRIPLQEENLTPGYHKITLNKYSVISDNICTDQNSPANWVKLLPSSFIFIDTKSSVMIEQGLSEYPFPFAEEGIYSEDYSVILLPDNPSASILSAAVQINSYLSLKGSGEQHITIMTESEWWKSKEEIKHVVAIGSIDSWSTEMKGLLPYEDVNNNEFILKMFTINKAQEKEKKELLFVLAKNDHVIAENMHILTDDMAVNQLTGNELVIQTPMLNKSNKKEEQKYSFEDYGYPSIIVDEIKQNSNSLFFNLPTWMLRDEESFLLLKVKFSQMLLEHLDEDDLKQEWLNGFTIYLNGIPKTFALTNVIKEENKDELEIKIPLIEFNLQEQNTRTVEVSFESNIRDVDNACNNDNKTGRWIMIENSSYFDGEFNMNASNSFHFFPGPFMNEFGFKKTAVIVPENIDGHFLTQLAAVTNMFYKTTQNTLIQLNNIPLILKEPLSEEQQEELENYHIIMLGEINRYGLFKDRVQDFLVQYESSMWKLNQFNIINEATNFVSWIQPSVWNKERSMIIFQGKEIEADKVVDEVLLMHLQNNLSDGQMLALSANGNISTIYFNNDSTLHETENNLKDTEEKMNNRIPYEIYIFIFSLIVIVFILYMYLRNRRKIDGK
ncbi:cellulose biosynthesis cyclic di-GMP-binding regulatory protein BcsB [Chengkuizengella axinellae]|uniref:Cellulose biosynthesis cyclic di-GMP-binding regulatory protein BcsB n=1 Tax=Chengkuizengella axinellae TaxID=3064388 RepID=A0ABT9J0Z7_9BACL|nr:cellulose biosynthesis cyclic di-GMP-binding regulatory protein BcsB [Chengkuizengella sp. 2205SS18-9]MDP5275272.1 cellulose biosynthesis cyclic di-GMP-binding regulatory protein BcsB [Chengkuizengella sp. 2205SS18-9]